MQVVAASKKLIHGSQGIDHRIFGCCTENAAPAALAVENGETTP
jgi:hypothetical protein